MVGRLLRLLVGLGILVVATDIWDPTLVPRGVPVSLGQFEDMKTPAACLLGVVGFALVFAAVWPRPAKRRRAVSVSTIALTSPVDFESAPLAAPKPLEGLAVEPIFDETRPAQIRPTAMSAADPIFPAAVSETAVAPPPAAAAEVPPETPKALGPEPKIGESLEPSAPWCEAVIETARNPPLAPHPPNSQPPAQIHAVPEAALAPLALAFAAPEPESGAEPALPEASAAPPSESSVAAGGESGASAPPTFADAAKAGDEYRGDGKLDEAMEKYEQALELARDQVKSTPGEFRARSDLAAALTNIGDVHDLEGRLEPAIEAHEESLKIRRGLAADAPYDKTALRSLVVGLERLADAREARGHRSRALDLYQESLPIAERLAVEHPDDLLHAQDLAITRARIADLQREMTAAD